MKMMQQSVAAIVRKMQLISFIFESIDETVWSGRKFHTLIICLEKAIAIASRWELCDLSSFLSLLRCQIEERQSCSDCHCNPWRLHRVFLALQQGCSARLGWYRAIAFPDHPCIHFRFSQERQDTKDESVPYRPQTISATTTSATRKDHIGQKEYPYRPQKMYCHLASTFISCQSQTRNVVYATPSHISGE